jgi:hypothetical protein
MGRQVDQSKPIRIAMSTGVVSKLSSAELK